jgi:chorismate lyase
MSRTHFPAIGHWGAHVDRHATSVEMREWLTNRQSLTLRLMAHCAQFRVQRLQQQVAPSLPDEFSSIGLPWRANVVERDVLLRCDDVAVVYAHTILPLSATARQWPLFATLGNKSLGSTLFHDPLVSRGPLQYAQLRASHPLMRRIFQLQLVAYTPRLWARRALFSRYGSNLLVTEVFLPALSGLFKSSCTKQAP